MIETAPLKNFATASRTELLAAVESRLDAVLSQASVERQESPQTVNALEQALKDPSRGRAHVIEQAAYTWFNRIIALRFMDVNLYTGIGVVSPSSDQMGQPEVLAAAKRGQLDPEIVKEPQASLIRGLLDGIRPARPGLDAQAEAYGLLLTAYCRHWHRTMPYMFGAEGDYTELLMPANLLADGSVLNRAVEVLTEDACRDVEVIGWLYQFYISERKDEVFAGFKKNKKAGAAEIPPATQLFTPHWIVRYLVENSVGRLWLLNHPESQLRSQMTYYIDPVEEETEFLQIKEPQDFRIIDPACGSGHMLTYAFDLLYSIYEERGYTPSEIPEMILTHNLRGVEIDQRAGSLAAFALTMKAAEKRGRRFLRKPVEPQICVLRPIRFTEEELAYLQTEDGDHQREAEFWNQFEHADTFGSLIQPDPELTQTLGDHLKSLDAAEDIFLHNLLDRANRVIQQAEYLCPGYSVVVANPPYMGSKQMNPLLSQFMKDNYTEGKQDLYGAFILRGIALAGKGSLAIIVGDTWMAIKSFEPLRNRLYLDHRFNSFIHLHDVSNHPDIFGANAAFVLGFSSQNGGLTPFVRLSDLAANLKEESLLRAISQRTAEAGWFLSSVEHFKTIPGSPIVYWLSEKMRLTFQKGTPLGQVAELRQGLATADNNRFLREWWEVSRSRTAFGCISREEALKTGARWFPYNKGGDFRKWYGNQEFVVNWENDGQEITSFKPKSVVRNPGYYFSPSVSWSDISSSDPAFRYYPTGFIFANTGHSIFLRDQISEQILCVLNSAVVREILRVLAPTIHFDIGYVGKIPIPNIDSSLLESLSEITGNSHDDWDTQETSWNFVTNPLIATAVTDVMTETNNPETAQSKGFL